MTSKKISSKLKKTNSNRYTKKNTNAKVYFSFVGNKVFLGINDNKDILKVGNINESVTEYGFLQKYFNEIEACIVNARKIVSILKIR